MLDGDFRDSVTIHCLLKHYANTLPVSVVIRLPSQAAVLSFGLENREWYWGESILEGSKAQVDLCWWHTCRRVNQDCLLLMSGMSTSASIRVMPESRSEVGVWERLPRVAQICPVSQFCVFFSVWLALWYKGGCYIFSLLISSCQTCGRKVAGKQCPGIPLALTGYSVTEKYM